MVKPASIEGKVALQNPKMTYIVKVLCLFVLFVAFEIGTEAQRPGPLDVSFVKDCFGERCFKEQHCCGPKAKCQQCCGNQHCPKGQICRYIYIFFAIHVLLTSDAKTQRKEF